ncbi:patatin-like phospholipase family protein [Lamprocystis purpurea]|jgi:NTE family protein|uniref:patatin-like phospholipase family protein n=1 Tax=Lamprocystis purpurea TaxID=61598 RepID=UPI00037A8A71|nr:patatin-like phospholipase family protein [Lamprocystis purpurea]
MKRLLLLLLICCVALPTAARDAAYPRIGLVLSGGGARGAAHVGVLKVLEELRIPIAVVVGTSMGALVGGTYASGVSPAEMARRLTEVNWNKLFVDDSPRDDWPIRRREQSLQPNFDFSVGVREGKLRLPSGALAGQKVELFFGDLVKNADGIKQFDELPIPFRAVATNLENGDMQVFDSGPLPEVMRASMSVPGIFAPVEIGENIYVDGGLVRNLPVDVARAMGVDLVIAVNLGGSYLPRDQLESVVGVVGQMVAILTEQNVQRSLKELRPGTDVLISPDLGDITSSNFDRAADAIRIGEIAARKAAPRLAHLSVSPDAYAAWRADRPLAIPDRAPIDEVKVAGLEFVNPAIFEPLIDHQEGRVLNRKRLESDIGKIYGRGDFKNINYDLDRTNGGNRLDINAREKPWGPGYLTFGLGIATDFEGDNRFGLRGTYRRTWINDLGAEWYTTAQIGNVTDLYTEFYQPFSVERSTFVLPSLGFSRVPLSVFKDGKRVARYDLSRSTLGLDLGATLFGGNAELRIGAILGRANAKLDTGDPELPEPESNETGLRAAFVYDTLDSAFLPRRGHRLSLDLRSPQPAMGADVSFNRASGYWAGAFSFGDNTIVAQADVGTAFGSDMPYYDQFTLGGFQRLSGYATDEFRGNNVAFGSLTYYRLLTALPPPLGRGVYIGGSLEVGTLSETIEQLNESGTRFGSSFFLGADTWLGPAYFGIGLTGDGETTGYIILGRP